MLPSFNQFFNGEVVLLVILVKTGVWQGMKFILIIILQILIWKNSWFVSSDHASYSQLVGPLQPRDTIVGNMTLNSAGQVRIFPELKISLLIVKKWVIETADTTKGQTTTLTVSTGVTEVDAFVTLEVYGISDCSDFPNGECVFSSLWLESNGVVQFADWHVSTRK